VQLERTVRRRLERLASQHFDLIVLGGGIYGSAISWDAALRGLKVALLERDDFGSGTSFNCSKTIHGGLRYLLHGDMTRVRESIRERRSLLRIAPHLVRPLPFLLPTYRRSLQHRAIVGALLLANDIVSLDRNNGLGPSSHVPRSYLLSRSECLAAFPGLEAPDLSGGAVWHDCQAHNVDRLTLAFVSSAAGAGAEPANHLFAKKVLLKDGKVAGVVATDQDTGDDLEIYSQAVVNATGPWVDELLAPVLPARPTLRFPKSRAINVITTGLGDGRFALALFSRGHAGGNLAKLGRKGHFLLVSPWRGRSIIGTKHVACVTHDDSSIEAHIRGLLEETNQSYPSARLSRSDVRLVHDGLVPGIEQTEGVRLVTRYTIDDHRKDRLQGLLSVVGIKYTTARDVAEQVVDRVFTMKGHVPPACRTAVTALAGGSIPDMSRFEAEAVANRPAGVSAASMSHLVRTYGTVFSDVLALIAQDPTMADTLSDTTLVSKAEILFAARSEMARTLPGAVLRRTELGSAGHPGAAALRTAASVMATELGWNTNRTAREIDDMERFYRARS
jgi:glycerol-3-phosphate dehydrogenase